MALPKEARIEVVAREKGFYEGARRRVGEVFMMTVPVDPLDDGDCGAYRLPSWVMTATDVARRVVQKQKQNAEDKFIAGAIAASSGAAGKRKHEELEARVKGGELQPGDSPIAAGGVAASGSAGHAQKKKAFEDAMAGRT